MSLLSVVLAGGGATRTLTAPFTVSAPPSSGTNFLLNPSAHIAPDGLPWPDATNSGWANYVDPDLGRKLVASDLTVHSGSFTTSQAGQVIKRMKFTGTSEIKIAHPGVTMVGCELDYTGSLFGISDHKTGETGNWTLDHCTFRDAPPALAPLNVEWANVTWCDISGGTDGWDPYNLNGVKFEHNYVHDLTPFNGSHSDCIQVVGGNGPTSIRYNTLLSTNPSSPIGAYAAGNTTVFPGNTSGLQVGQLTGDIGDIFFEYNLCDGGNYMFNANWGSDGTHNLVGTLYIRGNRYGRDQRYGLYTHVNDGKHNVVIAGNVDDATGLPA